MLGLKEIRIVLEGLLERLLGLVGVALLQLDETDVAPRHSEERTLLGSLNIVVQAALQITALHGDTAKLNIGFRHLRRVGNRFEEFLFGFHEITAGQVGHAQIVMGVATLRVVLQLALEVGDIVVEIVKMFHGVLSLFYGLSMPCFFKCSEYQRQYSNTGRTFSKFITSMTLNSLTASIYS